MGTGTTSYRRRVHRPSRAPRRVRWGAAQDGSPRKLDRGDGDSGYRYCWGVYRRVYTHVASAWGWEAGVGRGIWADPYLKRRQSTRRARGAGGASGISGRGLCAHVIPTAVCFALTGAFRWLSHQRTGCLAVYHERACGAPTRDSALTADQSRPWLFPGHVLCHPPSRSPSVGGASPGGSGGGLAHATRDSVRPPLCDGSFAAELDWLSLSLLCSVAG